MQQTMIGKKKQWHYYVEKKTLEGQPNSIGVVLPLIFHYIVAEVLETLAIAVVLRRHSWPSTAHVRPRHVPPSTARRTEVVRTMLSLFHSFSRRAQKV